MKPSRRRAINAKIAEVCGYRYLKDDWDTYGGQPSTERTIEFATGLLRALIEFSEIPPPIVCPLSTGVYMEWRSDIGYLYFEVDEDSVMWYATEIAARCPEGEDPEYNVAEAAATVKAMYGLPDLVLATAIIPYGAAACDYD